MADFPSSSEKLVLLATTPLTTPDSLDDPDVPENTRGEKRCVLLF